MLHIETVPQTVLYIAASQYSGSTLTSFLLNTHSQVTTAGHTMGWHFAEIEEFLCSCGKALQECPYYQNIAEAFKRANLPFDYRRFGTEYRIHRNDRLNRYLTASLPVVQSSVLELARDRIVSAIPHWSRRIRQQSLANAVFIKAAMQYSNAKVYVDNSHDPYRFRQLQRNPELRPLGLHLIRDPRGVVMSCMKHASWSAQQSIRAWIRRQSDIVRIFSESNTDPLTLCYENLCQQVDENLSKVYRFVGLEPEPFPGDFDSTPHHILGNAMRLKGGKIQLDEKWRLSLDQRSIDRVNNELASFLESIAGTPLSYIIKRYLDS